jgi:hypothetical protein
MDEFKPEPVHDWASHPASAFMGAAMSFKLDEKPKAAKIRYSNAGIV